MPCRIAFERGKERHFSFLAISMGTSGWLVLAEVLPLKQQFGVVRVAAPLAGSNVCIALTFPCYLSHLLFLCSWASITDVTFLCVEHYSNHALC